MRATLDPNQTAHENFRLGADLTTNKIQAPRLSSTKSGRFSVIGAPFGTPIISSETIQEVLDQDENPTTSA